MALLIQVGNLAACVDIVDLRRLFETYGTVKSAMINMHSETGLSTGVGFVDMNSQHEGNEAIAALHHRKHFGQLLSVCWSNASANSTSSSRSAGLSDELRKLR